MSFDFLRRLFGVSSQTSKKGASPISKRCLRLESLENRELLSVTPLSSDPVFTEGPALVSSVETTSNEITPNANEVVVIDGHTYDSYEWNLVQSQGLDNYANWKNFGDGATYYRLVSVHASMKNLSGDLNLSGCTELEYINCSYNDLTSLNLSGCTALSTLDCSGNKLTSLNLSDFTALSSLNCGNNQLTSLNISGCTALSSFDCRSNELTSLNLSGFTALSSLVCNGNQLTSLNLSGFTALSSLNCAYNELTALDLSDCEALKTLNFSRNNLTSLNISNCKALTSLDCSVGDLTSLNVSGCTALTSLSCESNRLTSLNASGLTALTSLSCSGNDLTSLNVAGCTALASLNCSGNNLTSLNVSSCTALSSLKCQENKLTSLSLSSSKALLSLDCYNNKLPSLNLAGFTSLGYLRCGVNQLTSLDLSNCSSLSEIHCNSNQLTTLDISSCSNLSRLYCQSNQLTSLDLSSCRNLSYLYCQSNQLKELHISDLENLGTINCKDNKITSLKLVGLSSLGSLNHSNNPLETVDLSNCTELRQFQCSFAGSLVSLNLSGCTSLTQVDCEYNKLQELNISGCTFLNRLLCFNNDLTFTTLPIFSGTYNYSPQWPIKIGDANGMIGRENFSELQSQYGAAGGVTTYKWYTGYYSDKTEISSALITNRNGVFTFSETLIGQKVYCEMTNTTFPDLTLETNAVEIVRTTDISPPESVTASQTGKDEVTIQFAPVYGAKSYNVYRKVDGNWKKIGSTDSTSYVDKGLEKGEYVYAVTAVGSYESEKSQEAHVTVNKPGSTITVWLIDRPSSQKALNIIGTDRADWIEIEETASQIIVHSFTADGKTEIEKWTYAKNQVSEIVFDGFGGNDTFKNWYRNGGYCSIDCTAYGGDGDDYLLGGVGKNVLDGGNGDNMVIGGNGVNVFYNTGLGSSAFVWRGTNDAWAAGSASSTDNSDDAWLLFATEDREGQVPADWDENFVYRAWTEEEIFEVVAAIEFSYVVTGSYKFARSTYDTDGAIYFCITSDYTGFAGRNIGDAIILVDYGYGLDPSTVIHEIAHYWHGAYEVYDLWQEFWTISWDSMTEMKDDAVAGDFSESYGMSNYLEDWTTTCEAVFFGWEPPNTTEKWWQKAEIVERFIDRIGNRSLPDAPSYFESTAQTHDSITLSWDPQLALSGYSIQYRESGQTNWITWTSEIDAATIMEVISGLSSETSYDFRIQAVNGAGVSSWTTLDNVSTMEAPTLPAPSNLRTTVSARTTLSLDWSDVENATGYEVQRLVDGEYKTVYFGTKSDFVDPDLASGTTYTYRVRAVAGTGASAWSDPVTGQTATAAQPDTPVFTNVVQESGGTTLSWTDLGADCYYVVFKNGIPVLNSETETTYVDTNPSTMNTYVIYAYIDGRWSYSPTKIINNGPNKSEILSHEIQQDGSIRFDWSPGGHSYVLFRNGIPATISSGANGADVSPAGGANNYVLYVYYVDSNDRGQWVWSETYIVNKSTVPSSSPLEIGLASGDLLKGIA